MKNALFVMLLFLSSFLFAEGGSTIGLKISPLVGYRSLKYSNPQSFFGRDDREKPAFGYRVGSEFRLTLSERLGLYTGLNYTNSGYKVNDEFRVADAEYNEIQGDVKLDYRFHALEIPVLFGYQLNAGNIKISPMLGVKGACLLKAVANYQIDSNGTSLNKDDKKNTTELYNPFNLWGHVAVDLAYHQDKYVLSFRPFYERMITNILKSNDLNNVKEFQYNYGAEIIFALTL